MAVRWCLPPFLLRVSGLLLTLLVGGVLPAPLAAQVTVRAPGGISVTPQGGPALTVSPNSSSSAGFDVISTRPVVTTVELLCEASGAVTSCVLDFPEVTLQPFQTTDI